MKLVQRLQQMSTLELFGKTLLVCLSIIMIAATVKSVIWMFS